MQIQGGIPIRQAEQIQQTGRDSLALKQGDVISGEVIRSEDGAVAIRLADGNVLTASVGEDVSLRVGQQVELTVSGMEGDRLVMRLGGAQGEAARLSFDPPRLTGEQQQAARIYSMMREYGVSPTRDAFSRVQSLLTSHPQMDERTAVFLCANLKEIPQGGEFPLRALAQALLQPQAGGPALSLQALMNSLSLPPGDAAQALLALLPPELSEQLAAAQAARQEGPLPSSQDGAQALAKYLQQAAPEGARVLAAQGRLPDAAALLRVASSLPAVQADALLRAFAQDAAPPGRTPPQDLLPALQRALTALASAPEAIAQQAQQVGQTPAAPAGQAPLPPPLQQLLDSLAAQPAPEQAATAPAPADAAAPAGTAPLVPPDGAAAPTQDAAPSSITLPQSAQTSPQPPAPPAEQAQALAQAVPRTAPELSQLAESLFARLPSAQQESGDELRRVTETLLRGLTALREGAQALPGREAAAAVAYQAENRAQALPQILQYSFVQIPVQLYDRRQNADLYVMRRPGKSPEAGEECTVLIALETENLGRVEAILRAAGSDVSVTFRMHPGGASEAIRLSLPELVASVNESGYRLREASITPLDEPVTPQTFLPLLDRLGDDALSRLDLRV